MTEKEFRERLESLAAQLFPWANSYGKNDAIKRTLAFFEAMNPGEYREMYRGLYNQNMSAQEWDVIDRPTERLRKLAFRLDEEGRYTDADICQLNVSNLPGVTRNS